MHKLCPFVFSSQALACRPVVGNRTALSRMLVLVQVLVFVLPLPASHHPRMTIDVLATECAAESGPEPASLAARHLSIHSVLTCLPRPALMAASTKNIRISVLGRLLLWIALSSSPRPRRLPLPYASVHTGPMGTGECLAQEAEFVLVKFLMASLTTYPSNVFPLAILFEQ